MPDVNPPKQSRSQLTLDRIVAATAELLRTKPFGAVTISEIVDRAGASVGSFYARFENKDALLDFLDDRYTVQVLSAGESLLRPGRWDGVPLGEIVRELVARVVGVHRASAGVARAVILHARTHPSAPSSERSARMDALIPRIFDLLLSRRAEMGHPRPDAAVPLAFLQMFHAVREVVLFPVAGLPTAALSDEELVGELTDAFLAYLRVDGAGQDWNH